MIDFIKGFSIIIIMLLLYVFLALNNIWLNSNNNSIWLDSNKSQVVIYVNFRLPSTEKRLSIIQNGKVIYKTWVTHGAGSGMGKYALKFSNGNNSHMSSLGRYRTLNIYNGKHGLSRRLQGLDSTNSNAYSRSIVIHSAPYIGHGKTGTSWGCFAVSNEALPILLKYTQPGTILIAYK